LADGDLAAADIDVGVAERGDDLRNGDAVGVELMQVDVDIVLLGRTAPRVDLHDPRHAEYATGRDPGLHRAQIGEPEMGWADDLIAIDLADRARHLDLRHLVGRQVDVLLQVQAGLGEREIVIDAVFEGDAHEGEAVERRRSDVLDAGRRIEADLHRNRVVALHLLGGQSRRLRGDLQNHRRRIRIGLDIEPGERNHPGAEEHEQSKENDRTPGQPERENTFEHDKLLSRYRSGRPRAGSSAI
jgi:hypothetical protein